MATLTKGEIVNQTYILMRISGLTVDPTPEDTSIALATLERMILSYENNGLFLSYNKSPEYPCPDPSEESGIVDSNIQAVTLLLYKNLAPAFGKAFPNEMREEADTAYRSLFNTIPPVMNQNRMQPAGQGSYPYCGGGLLKPNYMPTEDDITVNSGGQLDDLTI